VDDTVRILILATGNYNVRTAGIYSDIGLFTSRRPFGEDLTQLFNLLTGYTRPTGFHHLILAPSAMRDAFVERIRRERSRSARATRGASLPR
jgi:polyphosphate kinase